MNFTVRFWNAANECIMVDGKYGHDCISFEDAWGKATSLIQEAYILGAREMDINNEFYDIDDIIGN